MRNKHVTRFGDPTSPDGAVYAVSDQEGLALMAVDLELARRYVDRVQTTRSGVDSLAIEVGREQAKCDARISAAGVPTSLADMLLSKDRYEVEKVARGVTITEYQLFQLIHNCAQVGFRHRSRFPQYVPKHLVITEEDRAEMKQGEPRPFIKKISPLLQERRCIHVHFFNRGTEWHCFWFSYEDIEPTADKNHWLHGPHVHYISHLWANYTKAAIWASFDRRKTQISGNLHVRFKPFDFSDENWPTGKRTQGPSAWSFLFVPYLPKSGILEPTPTAQIATRGMWITKISLLYLKNVP